MGVLCFEMKNQYQQRPRAHQKQNQPLSNTTDKKKSHLFWSTGGKHVTEGTLKGQAVTASGPYGVHGRKD